MLILFEQNEFALYTIDLSLSGADAPVPIISVVGDVKNRARVEQVMRQYAPSVVFHAAAYKHVPLMEESNAWEAVQNNVLGTLVVAQAALKHNVRKWVLVSTDKAVNPTNVMGATKRLAEMVCQSLQQQGKTRFEIVRFGNVLGSAGSVIPLFQQQIERGGDRQRGLRAALDDGAPGHQDSLYRPRIRHARAALARRRLQPDCDSGHHRHHQRQRFPNCWAAMHTGKRRSVVFTAGSGSCPNRSNRQRTDECRRGPKEGQAEQELFATLAVDWCYGSAAGHRRDHDEIL